MLQANYEVLFLGSPPRPGGRLQSQVGQEVVQPCRRTFRLEFWQPVSWGRVVVLLRDSEHLPPLGVWDPSNRDASPRLRLCGPKGLSHRWCLNEIQSTVLNITCVRSVTHVGPRYTWLLVRLLVLLLRNRLREGYGSWFIAFLINMTQ